MRHFKRSGRVLFEERIAKLPDSLLRDRTADGADIIVIDDFSIADIADRFFKLIMEKGLIGS